MEKKYGVYRKGGSVGSHPEKPIKVFDDVEEAKAYASRLRKELSPGERSYYKMGYVTRVIKESEDIDTSYTIGDDVKGRFIREGKWNHNDVGRDGPVSSYKDNGSKVKFFVSGGKWKYDGFAGTTKVAGSVPAEYVDAFDDGDTKQMTKFAKSLYEADEVDTSYTIKDIDGKLSVVGVQTDFVYSTHDSREEAEKALKGQVESLKESAPFSILSLL